MASVRRSARSLAAAYHAKHLELPNLDQIIGPSDLWTIAFPNALHIICSGIEEPGPDQSLRELLYSILRGIFQVPLDFEALVQQLKEEIKDRSLRLIGIGPTPLSSYLEKALAPKSVYSLGAEKLLACSNVNQDPLNKDSIAIIGMAGKFPGAENPEELWQILEQGKDLHRKVANESST